MRGIGRTAVMAGLGALLLATAGAWDDAEASDRGRRGRHHHHHGFHHGSHFHGPRVFVGPRFYVGPRVYHGSYYSYPYYPYYGGYYYGYAPPPVVVAPPATSYIERPPSAAQYWHYCQNPAGYYPDVQQCPGGWIQVAPRPE
ncbi:MAG: hypothetical protein ACREN5_00810, partial [Gemmatimonadales bacterium]